MFFFFHVSCFMSGGQPIGTMDNPAMPPPPPQDPLPGQVPPAYPGPPVQSQPLQPGYAAHQPPPRK